MSVSASQAELSGLSQDNADCLADTDMGNLLQSIQASTPLVTHLIYKNPLLTFGCSKGVTFLLWINVSHIPSLSLTPGFFLSTPPLNFLTPRCV